MTRSKMPAFFGEQCKKCGGLKQKGAFTSVRCSCRCVFCDAMADTTINHGKTDCCQACKDDVRRENEEANEITFEKMEKLVYEMKDEPFTSQIRVDPKAMQLLKEFAQEVVERNNQVLQPLPFQAVNVYGGTPVFVDKTLKPGQWKAVDRNGNDLEEGSLLPRRLLEPTTT